MQPYGIENIPDKYGGLKAISYQNQTDDVLDPVAVTALIRVLGGRPEKITGPADF